jgi:hypothetical protein
MRPVLRLASYNVEWFTELFADDGAFLNDGSDSRRYGVTKMQQFAAIGSVLQALDADGVMIIEAPDHSESRSAIVALEGFAAHFGLRARRAVSGFASQTRQEILWLYDPDVMSASHAPMGLPDPSSAAPRFDFDYRYDLDGDGIVESIAFSKPPLEVLTQIQNGPTLRLMGVHAKSKAPRNTHGPAEFIAKSIENRRTQLAECLWLRGRINAVLAEGTPLIVLGDLNDGPGLDEYEQVFGHSSVEVVMGSANPQLVPLFDPHAAKTQSPWPDTPPVSARFYLPKTGYFETLLDFIMVCPRIAALQPKWYIWHPLHAPAALANPALASALLLASDHFPVTIDINLPWPDALA